jgi:hypothetical protein
MKKLLVTLAAVLVSVSSFAQGTVIFNNRTQSGDAPVSRPDGTGAGAGITAQLYLVPAGGGTPVPLTPTTTFRSTSAAAAYFVTAIDEFAVTGVLPGQPATLRLRAWETAAGSYEVASAGGGLWGQSNDVTISQLGGTPVGGAPIPTPSLNGLQGFALIPEPSTMALGILGAAALLFRRRK